MPKRNLGLIEERSAQKPGASLKKFSLAVREDPEVELAVA
jgi:hypothetical protein